VTYGGSWTDYNSAGRINGDEHHTKNTGNYAQLTFVGTQITWIVTKAVNRGNADVYIDGIHQTTIDEYSPGTLYQQDAYVKTGLASGSHTIKIVCKGTKNASSTGTYIDVDAFKYQ
jgi:hypothetical protein